VATTTPRSELQPRSSPCSHRGPGVGVGDRVAEGGAAEHHPRHEPTEQWSDWLVGDADDVTGTGVAKQLVGPRVLVPLETIERDLRQLARRPQPVIVGADQEHRSIDPLDRNLGLGVVFLR